MYVSAILLESSLGHFCKKKAKPKKETKTKHEKIKKLYHEKSTSLF